MLLLLRNLLQSLNDLLVEDALHLEQLHLHRNEVQTARQCPEIRAVVQNGLVEMIADEFVHASSLHTRVVLMAELLVDVFEDFDGEVVFYHVEVVIEVAVPFFRELQVILLVQGAHCLNEVEQDQLLITLEVPQVHLVVDYLAGHLDSNRLHHSHHRLH